MATPDKYNRRYERLHVPFSVRILTYNYRKVDSEYCTCAEGLDISPGGISFKYPRVIEVGDHLKVLIGNLRGLKHGAIIASMRIAWAHSKDNLSRRFGGRFLKISPEDKLKLIKLVSKRGGKRKWEN